MAQLANLYGTTQQFTIFTWSGQGAITATEIINNTQTFGALCLEVAITATGGTPTLNVYIQKELADGTYTDLASLTQLTSGAAKRFIDIRTLATAGNESAIQDAALAAATVNSRPFGNSLRIKAVIAGTTPSYTGTVTLQLLRFN